MRTMENEKLRVQISDHGAELSSIYDKAADREAVWIGDPAFWNRHAPVLFPFVGKVNGGFYTHKGIKYPMGQHGFARDKEFACMENTENKTVHRLVSTDETKKVYPFDFAFTVTQKLSGRTVTVIWEVENTGEEDLYFSVGGHPAFNCPLKEGEKQEDCQLVFDTEGPLTSSILNEEGALCPRTKILNLFGKCLKLEEHLFDEDALIIENHQAQRIGLADADGKVYLEVEFDAPLFGIWSPAKKHAPFVCIEPWYGRSDREDFDHILENREWGNELEPGDIFEKDYKILVK